MTADQLRRREMQVRVFSECPKCGQLAEGVEERVLWGKWLVRIKETSCQPCAARLQREYLGEYAS